MTELTPLAVADAAEMTGVLSDPELYRVTGGRPPTEDELRERYARQVVGRSADGSQQWLNWVVRSQGQAVGFVQATVDADGRAGIAWVIGTPWQRRGLATDAVLRMVGLLEERPDVRTVEAWIAPGHLASERVAERVGLVAADEHDEDGERRWTRDDT